MVLKMAKIVKKCVEMNHFFTLYKIPKYYILFMEQLIFVNIDLGLIVN